jgi:transposase InsO family protein
MKAITQLNEEKGIAVNVMCDALEIPRATYYRHQGDTQNVPVKPKESVPKNALNHQEKQIVLGLLHGERFVDKTPYVVFNTLIDEGEYHCSIRTMYRLLLKQGENIDRRRQRNHRDAIKPELIATRPNEVWSWDITKLRGLQKFEYFHLYVILDIFSRYVVGWMIAERESQELARKLIQECALRQGIQPHQLSLHADNGPSMKSLTVAQLLEHLGIIKTHNRPYTSNDNPYSESHFKTLKYCPEFPGQFNSIKEAESFCQKFFNFYNKEHYHSGIMWLTPESVHYGQYEEILKNRHQTRLRAFMKNPLRFNNKAPMLKELPQAVYINPPKTVSISTVQQAVIMA